MYQLFTVVWGLLFQCLQPQYVNRFTYVTYNFILGKDRSSRVKIKIKIKLSIDICESKKLNRCIICFWILMNHVFLYIVFDSSQILFYCFVSSQILLYCFVYLVSICCLAIPMQVKCIRVWYYDFLFYVWTVNACFLCSTLTLWSGDACVYFTRVCTVFFVLVVLHNRVVRVLWHVYYVC